MKIIEIREIEDCFDQSIMKEILLDQVIQKDFIESLGTAGSLEYFPTFARPFFKLEVSGKYIVKGIEGNRSVRIILGRKAPVQYLKDFEKFLESV